MANVLISLWYTNDLRHLFFSTFKGGTSRTSLTCSLVRFLTVYDVVETCKNTGFSAWNKMSDDTPRVKH